MSQPNEVMGWAGVVLGSTYHSGTQLLSGGAVCLSAWSPMSQQEGKDGVHTWEILYRSGLEGAHNRFGTHSSTPSGGGSLGSVTFLPTQKEG